MAHKMTNKPKFNTEPAMWRYQVTATLKSPEAITPYLAWLFDGHVKEV